MKSKKVPAEENRLQRSPFTTLRLTDGRSSPKFIARLESGPKIYSNGAYRAECREIEFARLPDGTVLDLLRDRSGKLVFAVLQNGAITVRHTVKNSNINFITPQGDLTLAEAIRFPTAIGASLTARELLQEIDDVLDRYCDCDPAHRKLLAHFALYTWVSDLLRVAPYIWVVGPSGYGKQSCCKS